MGYRWHQGRLLSDEEYWISYQDPIGFLKEVANFIGYFGALLAPSIGLMILGYTISQDGVGILIGLILGIGVSWLLFDVLCRIIRFLAIVAMIGAAISVVIFIVWAILQIK
jgi:hypothetical protein